MQRPARLLIVEDERLIALDLQERVTLLGDTVVARAATGLEAIHQALAHRPDLVLLDSHLQGAMDGIEAAAFLRTHVDLPVVDLSADVDETTRARAHATRPAGYLCKPFTEYDLQHTLARAVGELPPAVP
jgi:two-component system cell cycle sensor histidine kinase/response regulator CckA